MTASTDIEQVWTKVSRLDSADARVFKYVFTADDAVAESILYCYPDLLKKMLNFFIRNF